ncbi:MAG: hypothetical protein LBP92_07030 [Deltaproteobacteria bacterium]|jgi:hypothetical protein|nr:hypothetical protein [Deltaproteobacteria bacterium]
MKPILALLAVLALVAAPGCGLNRSEYDRMRDIKNEYLAQLAEIRQANETINRNILSAYQELGVLRARLGQRDAS